MAASMRKLVANWSHRSIGIKRARTIMSRKLSRELSRVSSIGGAMSTTKNDNILRELGAKKSTIINNAKYENDVNYAIQMNRWLLKPLGLWPMSYDDGKILERNVARFLAFASISLLAFVLVSGSLHTFVKEKNSNTRLKLIGVLSFCVMAIVKYASLMKERRAIGRCIQHVVTDWARLVDNEERAIMYDRAILGRYGTALCTCFMYGGGIFYAGIMPILTGNVVIPESNLTIRPLPYPGYFVLFDPQISPIYEIVYATHCCTSFVMHSTSTAACSLAVLFVMHACSQLEIVVFRLNRLVDGGNGNSTGNSLNARLANIIDHHVRTLSFVSWTEKLLRNICLVELLGCTLNLCLLGFDLLMEWEHSGPIAMLTYAILITSFVFNILLFCYIGDILIEECKKVGEKTYMIDWYKLPRKTALGLILTIATAHNPTTITAGKMTKLSITTFCTVIKTSIGYLNILRTLTA